MEDNIKMSQCLEEMCWELVGRPDDKFQCREWTSGFYKGRRIYWPTKRLPVPQKGINFMGSRFLRTRVPSSTPIHPLRPPPSLQQAVLCVHFVTLNSGHISVTMTTAQTCNRISRPAEARSLAGERGNTACSRKDRTPRGAGRGEARRAPFAVTD
jgi:hypothetical protein